jgi:hypothetical protein
VAHRGAEDPTVVHRGTGEPTAVRDDAVARDDTVARGNEPAGLRGDEAAAHAETRPD